MFFLAIVGVAAVVAGGAAIWFGIPVKEFSFGNTMILAGAVAICNGLLLVGLGLVVRELKAIKQNLRERAFESVPREVDRPLLPAGSIGRGSRSDRDAFDVHHVPSENLASAGARRQVVTRSDDSDASVRDAGRTDAESNRSAPELAVQSPPPAKGRRNLLFSSSRKEREKSQVGLSEAATTRSSGALSADPASGTDVGGRPEPHPSFSDTWPRADRSSRVDVAPSRRDATLSPPLQADRMSSSAQDASAATVVKSGTVDGMAYSLYSDGSIEAQMPEGMMRFTSIEQLRAHLDRSR
ncbi:MAG: hypothetical protein WBA48_08460 [Xanthobacteraceae bacterium]